MTHEPPSEPWKPIAEAPTDGTLVIGLDRNAADVGWMYPCVMRYDRMGWKWNDGREWKRWPAPGPLFWVPIPAI